MTPVRTEEAHKENSSTIWYNSKYYRSNLYYRDNQIMLRDIFVFNEKYRERYFDTVTVDGNLYFDNLPAYRFAQMEQGRQDRWRLFQKRQAEL